MITLINDLISIIKATPKIYTQNKLMGCTDREIALLMLYMNDAEKNYIYSLIAPSKSERIKQEIILLKRIKIADNVKKSVYVRLIDRFKGGNYKPGPTSYIKPRNR